MLVSVIVSALCCCLRLVVLVPCACDGFDVCGSFCPAPSQYFVYAWVDDVDLRSGLLVSCEVLPVGFAVHYPHGCVGSLQCFGDCCASCGLCHCLHCRCVVVVVCVGCGECVGDLVVVDGDVAGLPVFSDVGGLPCGGWSGDDVEGDGVCPLSCCAPGGVCCACRGLEPLVPTCHTACWLLSVGGSRRPARLPSAAIPHRRNGRFVAAEGVEPSRPLGRSLLRRMRLPDFARRLGALTPALRDPAATIVKSGVGLRKGLGMNPSGEPG